MHMDTQALKTIEQVSLDNCTAKENLLVGATNIFIEGNKVDRSPLHTYLLIGVVC